jgi:hypothetical protein
VVDESTDFMPDSTRSAACDNATKESHPLSEASVLHTSITLFPDKRLLRIDLCDYPDTSLTPVVSVSDSSHSRTEAQHSPALSGSVGVPVNEQDPFTTDPSSTATSASYNLGSISTLPWNFNINQIANDLATWANKDLITPAAAASVHHPAIARPPSNLNESVVKAHKSR